MKTPHLDNLINDLKAYDKNDMLSDNGRNQLNEYEAIKQALTIADVGGQREQYCDCNVKGSFDEETVHRCRKCDKIME